MIFAVVTLFFWRSDIINFPNLIAIFVKNLVNSPKISSLFSKFNQHFSEVTLKFLRLHKTFSKFFLEILKIISEKYTWKFNIFSEFFLDPNKIFIKTLIEILLNLIKTHPKFHRNMLTIIKITRNLESFFEIYFMFLPNSSKNFIKYLQKFLLVSFKNLVT